MKIRVAILLAVGIALLVVTSALAIDQVYWQESKCYNFYDGSTYAARICKTQTFGWFPAEGEGTDVVCKDQGIATFSEQAGYDIVNRENKCINYPEFSQAKAVGKLVRADGSVVFSLIGTIANGFDDQPGFFEWFKFQLQ
jgi:hypothetical protein